MSTPPRTPTCGFARSPSRRDGRVGAGAARRTSVWTSPPASGPLEGELTRLDTAVRNRLAAIPDGRRRIVSCHESMAYFADRYGLEIVGVLLPSLTSQAQVSAANLAALRARIEAEGVRVIFDETGTPRGVADAVARETGARVVELATHTLPDDGTYESFIEKIADTIATADAAG